MKKILLCIIPLAIIAFFVRQLTSSSESKPDSSVSADVSSSNPHEAAKVESGDLRSTKRVVKAKSEAEEPPAGVNGVSKELLAQVTKMNQNTRNATNATELLRFKKALGLDAAQVKQLEAFYESKAKVDDFMMEKMLSGGDLKGVTKDAELLEMTEALPHSSVSSLFDEILTEDQTSDYEAYKKNQVTQQKEAAAYQELSKIQGSAAMTDEQKDAVFTIFNDQAYKKSAKKTRRSKLSYVEERKLENERLFESLSTVLDESQLEIYKQEKEAELKGVEQSVEMIKQISL